jgi:hypothetical protein
MPKLHSLSNMLQTASDLLLDALRFAQGILQPRAALAAENLFLRKQLALYLERQVKPQRAGKATRLVLVLLSRLFPWRPALTVVKPETFVRWHRQGFRLFWRWKSKPRGRPRIPAELQKLIVMMADDNPTWGEPRATPTPTRPKEKSRSRHHRSSGALVLDRPVKGSRCVEGRRMPARGARGGVWQGCGVVCASNVSLQWLISPFSKQVFLEEYWEKRPLVVKRDQPNYFSSLLSLDRPQCKRHPRLRRRHHNCCIEDYRAARRAASPRGLGFRSRHKLPDWNKVSARRGLE